MNKKLVIGIVVAVVVIAIACGDFFMLGGSKELNLEEVSAKISSKGGFEEMGTSPIDSEFYSSYMAAKAENVEEMVGKFPMMNVHASMYLIVKAKPGTVDAVKQDLENFGQVYDDQWARYLPAQYELVQNRKIGTYGDYAYIIIAQNAEELEKLIK